MATHMLQLVGRNKGGTNGYWEGKEREHREKVARNRVTNICSYSDSKTKMASETIFSQHVSPELLKAAVFHK